MIVESKKSAFGSFVDGFGSVVRVFYKIPRHRHANRVFVRKPKANDWTMVYRDLGLSVDRLKYDRSIIGDEPAAK